MEEKEEDKDEYGDDGEDDDEDGEELVVCNPNKGGKNTEHFKTLAQEDEKKKLEIRNAQIEEDRKRLAVVKKRRE